MKLTKTQLKKIIKEELFEMEGDRYTPMLAAVDSFKEAILTFRQAGGARNEVEGEIDAMLNEIFPEDSVEQMHSHARGEWPE